MDLALPGLLSWFRENATVVTSSRLHAAVAYRQFAAARFEQRVESWARPAVLPLGAWLTERWQTARYTLPDVPALLSPSQEHLLWKQIVTRESVELFDADATARLAARSARLAAEWLIPPTEADRWEGYADARQFARWHQAFRRRCQEQDWLASFDLWRWLPLWAEKQAPSAARTVFAGVEKTPALTRVLQAMSFAGEHVPYAAAAPATDVHAANCGEWEAEIELAARWARAAFEDDAARSIGVIVPSPEKHRSTIDRSFRRVFYPAAPRTLIDPTLRERMGDTAYHLNAGSRLLEEPLIGGTLLLLELAQPRIPMGDAGAILRSPWIKGAEAERSSRALADLQLRRKRELDVSLGDLIAQGARSALLVKRLASVERRLRRMPATDSYGNWSRLIGDLLAALGWPGDIELNDREQQLVERWKDALSQLSALSLVGAPLAFDAALAELKLLLDTSFTEHSTAPVQIVSASEAAGLRFDRAILTGLSQSTWPPPRFRSPLIPLKQQMAAGVPGSAPDSAAQEMRRQTASLFETAPHVTVTYNERLAPIALAFVSHNSEQAASNPSRPDLAGFAPALLEEIEDSVAPPYRYSENARGGTGIIKSQSACPFRAFAEYRLASLSPEEGCLGLDARDKGGHLHGALEFVWHKLGSLAALRAAGRDELARLIEAAARDAIRQDSESSFGRIVTEVELARLREVISDWLAIERDRKHPFTIETVEEERFADLGGLRLRLRVDRIDRLADGTILLIDYKSGAQTRNKLKGERPAEPQLLVYASAVEGDVGGVFFAQLKPRETRAVGIAREKYFSGNAVDGLKSKWSEYLEESRANVTALASEFQQGYAVVNPAPHACDYCSQKPFCRIQEMRGQEENEE